MKVKQSTPVNKGPKCKVILLDRYGLQNSLGKTLSYQKFQIVDLRDSDNTLEAFMWASFEAMKKHAEIFSKCQYQRAKMVARSTEPADMSGSLPQAIAMCAMHKQTLKSFEIVQDSKGRLSMKNGGKIE